MHRTIGFQRPLDSRLSDCCRPKANTFHIDPVLTRIGILLFSVQRKARDFLDMELWEVFRDILGIMLVSWNSNETGKSYREKEEK